MKPQIPEECIVLDGREIRPESSALANAGLHQWDSQFVLNVLCEAISAVAAGGPQAVMPKSQTFAGHRAEEAAAVIISFLRKEARDRDAEKKHNRGW